MNPEDLIILMEELGNIRKYNVVDYGFSTAREYLDALDRDKEGEDAL